MTSMQLTRVPSVHVQMLIRRPPAEVFRTFADPSVTTRFWFTKSTGPLVPGAKVEWTWEMYSVSTTVVVKEIEPDRRIVVDWNDDPTTVEFRFTPAADDSTFVEVFETGLHGTGDELADYVAQSTSGFSFVLAAAKALLEHDIELRVVADLAPDGL